MSQKLSVEFSFIDMTDILILLVVLCIYQIELYINRNTLITPIEMHKISNIYYALIVPITSRDIPSFKRLMCLATLKSCNTTKQTVC